MKAIVPFLLACFTLLGAGVAHAGNGTQIFINTSSDIYDMAYDSQDGILYMSNTGPYILRYDVIQRKLLSSILIGGNLYGIDVSEDGKLLAAADGNSGNGVVWIDIVDLANGDHRKISGAGGVDEAGTLDVAFYKDGNVVVSGAFAGSGFEPIKIANIRTGTLTSIGDATNSTVLRPSPDHGTVGYTQGDISDGPWGIVSVPKMSVNQLGTENWFTYDLAVSSGGRRFALPTYYGTFVFRHNGDGIALLGKYAMTWFNGAVFDPGNDKLLYQTLAGSSQIELWNTLTQTVVKTISASQGSFPDNGNGSFSYGYMRISPDGKMLFVKIAGGVLLVPLK